MNKKRILALMLCAALSISAFGVEFKEGTYIGEAKGYRGEVKVEVKTSKNKIKEVKVIKNTDTPIISESAAKKVPKQIVKYQSLRVDGVSGATGTSRALTSAVRNALKNSGADLKELNKKPVIEAKKLVKETQNKDVVVIGAGGAGLVAAIEAKNNGAKNVIVLEKMAFAGGNTLISGGEYAAPNNWVQVKKGLKDSNDAFYNDILKGGDNEGDPKLVRVLADNALSGAEWLKDYINMTFEDRQMFFGGHSVERSLVPQGATGVEMISKQIGRAHV